MYPKIDVGVPQHRHSAAHEHQGIDCSRQHMPRPGLMSAPRPDEPPRFPDHRTGSVDGENRNRNTQSTRRVQTSRGAMCHLPFHSTPGFSRRFVSSGTLCVLCLSARRATRCRANHCRPLRDGGVGGAVGKRAGASHGCHASSLAAFCGAQPFVEAFGPGSGPAVALSG